MEVEIELHEDFTFVLDESKIKEITENLLNYLSPGKKSFLLLKITNDREIAMINGEFRNKMKPTDVLSFPEPELPIPYRNLGTIFISYETMIKQALEIGHSETDEFLRLLVHGVLHLFGFDHEISKFEEKKMQEKEDECLEYLYKFII